MTTVGLVGLGLLGHAVASRLLGAGHSVVGFKDLHLIQDAAAGVGAPLPLIDVAARLYAAAQAAGRGGEDLAAVVTALDDLAGCAS